MDADAGGDPAHLLHCHVFLRICLPGDRARQRRRPIRRRFRCPGGAGKGRAKDMGERPGLPSYGDSDEDTARLRILPLPGERNHMAADGPAANGASSIEPPPADHGVSPSHPIADQF